MLKKYKYQTYKVMLASAALLFTVSGGAFAATTQIDQLFLKNGDRLSGEISGYTASTVTIDTSFGTFDVPLEKIGGVASPVYDMADFTTATPAPVTIPQAASLTPIESETEILAATEPAAGLKNEDRHTGLWGAKWSGSVNAGGEIETGNSDNETFTADADLEANWNDIHRATLGADYDWEMDEGVKTSDELKLDGGYDYFFADRWFWNNRASYEQDKIENLDYRVIVTSGLGYQVFDTEDLSLEITFGPGYEREEYEGQDADDNATANWSLDYEQAFYEDFFRTFHNHTLTSPWDDFNSYLFESETGIKIPLDNGITASGEVEFDWNNDPATGEQEDDTTYALKLGYEW